eukprot:scaffold569_cov165-Amphora_coffeaeformis.AAC.26
MSSRRSLEDRSVSARRWRPRLSLKRASSDPAQTVLACKTQDDLPNLVELSSFLRRSSPRLEASEVSYDSERSADDALIKPSSSPPPPPSNITADQTAIALLTTTTKVLGRLKEVTHSTSLPASPHVYAVAVGIVLPKTWILYMLLSGLFLAFQSVVVKWVAFVLKDPEVVKFRRGISHSLKMLEKELELTVQGNYSRQVVASYVFYVSTAPGESSIGAFLRQTSQAINMRVVEDIKAAQARFSCAQDRMRGYRQAAKTYPPFS